MFLGIKLMTLTLLMLKEHMMPKIIIIILKIIILMAIMYLVDYFDEVHRPP